MRRKPKMGNFFSGSGTWELAAKICGIEVVFESEIEPFPVALEAKRFPEAIQLGDVSKVNGADLDFVDIITNSSPCQDLSIAGRRDGLGGGRSGLFHEVIRITKEMRDAYSDRLRSSGPDEPVRLPGRFWCWENVPGAFSSNRGEDFRVVLEEVARIIDPEAVIPMPPKGKWSYSGIVDGDGYQIAWRTLDAQFFGVPQRRRRVFLVADFGGRCASEVLFEYEGLSWNFEKIAETWEDTSRSFDDRIDSASRIVLGGVPQTSRGVDKGELNRPE